MSVDRIQRLNEGIRRALGSSLYHIGQGEEIDTALISFVAVETARDLRTAIVHVSFMGDAEQQAHSLKWLRRHRVDFQAWIAKEVQLKYTPKLRFMQTGAVEKGDRVLDILSRLEDSDDQD
jgi:ribosome-binding factor A